MSEAKALTFFGLVIAFLGYFLMDIPAATVIGVGVAAVGFVAWVVKDYQSRASE